MGSGEGKVFLLCLRGLTDSVDWHQLIKGVQAKQMGFLEILCWHLVEVAELKKMNLPIGQEGNAPLAKAVEERLGKFIKLKQFHFRYTKEMIFAIVHDCTNWSPNPAMNDVQNLKSAFDNISHWGTVQLVDAEDVHHMGSVNERGFLFFFAMFIPSLEGWAGPKKTAAVVPVVPSVDVEELERLRRALANAEGARDQAVAREKETGTRCEELTGTVTKREHELAALRDQLNACCSEKEILRAEAASLARERDLSSQSGAKAEAALSNEIQTLRTQLQQANATALAENKGRLELYQQAKELQEAHATISEKLHDRDAIIKRLKQEKADLAAAHAKELQSTLEQLDQAHANTVNENKGRHELYNKSKELQDYYVAQCNERDAAIAALKQENSDMQKQLASQHETGEEALKKAQQQLRTKNQQFSAVLEDCEATKSELARVQEELAIGRQQQASLGADLEAAQQRLVALEGDATEAHQDLDEVRQARLALLDELSRLKSALADTEARLASKEAEADALASRLSKQDFDGLSARTDRLMQEYAVAMGDIRVMQDENERLTRALRALELKMPLFARQGKNTTPPPLGDVTLVFTDVEGSTVQWEWDAETAAAAIRVHNDLMRMKLEQWGGYEVKTEGDAFMVAFADPVTAVSWCLDTQETLLNAKWPEKLYEHKKSAIVYSESGLLLYRGLRVRMGVHCGNPSAEEDPVNGRMDYFGPMVNRSARVESVANGGQVVCSRQVYDRVHEALKTSAWTPTEKDLGLFELKGLNDATHIMQFLPFSLRERTFAAAVNAEAELLAEKSKLQDELKALQAANAELSNKLAAIDETVMSQQEQAQALLADVHKAKLSGVPSEELLGILKKELSTLLAGQTETSGQLQKAIAVNNELSRSAVEMADRRERIVLESVAVEKKEMEGKISTLRFEVEVLKKNKSDLESQVTGLRGEVSVAASQGNHLEDELSEARRQYGNLQREVANLKEQLGKGAAAKSELEDEMTSQRSLLDAMAKRIEMVEGQLESAESKGLKMGAFYKQQSDAWALEEIQLKKIIRDLEERLQKRQETFKRAETDNRLEVLELRQQLREKDPLLKGIATSEANEEGKGVSKVAPTRTAAVTTSAVVAPSSPFLDTRNLSSRFSKVLEPAAAPPEAQGSCADCHRIIFSKSVTVSAMGKIYHEDVSWLSGTSHFLSLSLSPPFVYLL